MKKWLLEKRGRIILSGMLIVAVPLASLAFFVYLEISDHLKEMIIEENKSAAINIADHIQETIKNDIQAGTLLTERPFLKEAVKKADRKDMTGHIKNFVDNVISIERAFIASKVGVAIANYPEDLSLIGRDFSDRDWYKGVSKAWQPYVSKFYLRAAEPQRYLFAIALPIRDDHNKVLGVFVMQPEPDYIRNSIEHIFEHKKLSIYVVDSEGNLIHHPQYAVDRIVDFSGFPTVKKTMQGMSGVEVVSNPDGTRMFTAYHPIRAFGWSVIVQRPEKEVFAHLRRVTTGIFIFAGVILLISAYFAYRRSELIFSLNKLSGELETKVEERTADLQRAKREWVGTFDAITDPIFIHDKEFRLIRANRAYQEAAGMSFDEIIGKPYYQVFPKMDDPFKMCLEALEEMEEKEEVFLPSSGKTYMISFYPVRDKDDEFLYSAHIMEDITEERKAHERLVDAELRYRTIFQQSPLGVLLVDPETGLPVEFNDTACRQLGYNREEFAKLRISDYEAVESHEETKAHIERLLREGSDEFETRHRTKEGEIRDVVVTVKRLKLKGRQFFHCILRDVTDIRQAEERLRLEAEILNSTSDSIFVLNQEGRFLYVNEAAYRSRGYTKDKLMTMGLSGLDTPEYSNLLNERITGLMQHGELTFESEHVRKDGTVMPVEVHARVLEHEGERLIIGSVRDITERKRIESLIRKYSASLEDEVKSRTRELEDANKELESFSYSVSHDLRAPLRAIDGFSNMLLEDYNDRIDDEGKRLLNVVRENTGKMGQLIDDLLQFSRMGRKEISMAKVDMEKLFSDVYAEIKEFSPGREIQFILNQLPVAYGDPAMIRQVVLNLLSNSIKYTRPKDRVVIDVGCIRQAIGEGQEATGELVYYVKDNGVGFDMNYADKLFGVFQRLHGQAEFEGTGIGLAIVKRIITRHGGRVWAEGKVGEGAVVYFTLPQDKRREMNSPSS